MNNPAKKNCCICGRVFHGYGNNPEPVWMIENEDGTINRCCDWCNTAIVIPIRLHVNALIRYAQENSDPMNPPDLDDVLRERFGHDPDDLTPDDLTD